MKIPNLHRPEASEAIMGCEFVYAMEKIHGTSAHFSYSNTDKLRVFSGGIKHETFMLALKEKFDLELLIKRFSTKLVDYNANNIVVFGEAYGGKCQKMGDVYGPLNFIAFEVKIDNKWLKVPNAERLARSLGFEFVYFERGKPTIEWLDSQRNKPSVQAFRNGCGDNKISEGVVIRSINDDTDRFGNRIIAKYKNDKFRETKAPREVSSEITQKLINSRAIAEEWCTLERLNHVIDAIRAKTNCRPLSIGDTGFVIKEMIIDIKTESYVDSNNPEIEWSLDVGKSIGTKSALLFKRWLNDNTT